jgi:hypothetical protein
MHIKQSSHAKNDLILNHKSELRRYALFLASSAQAEPWHKCVFCVGCGLPAVEHEKTRVGFDAGFVA